MAQEIEYAVREAFGMQLSEEQSIKFVMRMAKVDREAAKQELIRANKLDINSFLEKVF